MEERYSEFEIRRVGNDRANTSADDMRRSTAKASGKRGSVLSRKPPQELAKSEQKHSALSLMAARDHVFLTWHDIDFIVPNKDGAPQVSLNPKDINPVVVSAAPDSPPLSRRTDVTGTFNGAGDLGAPAFGRPSEEQAHDNERASGDVDGRMSKISAHNQQIQRESTMGRIQTRTNSMATTPTESDSMAPGAEKNEPVPAPREKQVLHHLSGYAKPGQVMAIMGASGCGKTSFLNILGQRLGLSPGAKMEGEVRCNDRPV